MSDPSASRFAPQNKTTQERLSTNTVGLVALSDFRKRRAEVLEQQGREQDALATGTSTPDRSQTATPDVTSGDSGDGASSAPRALKKSKKKTAKKLLSFDDDGDDGEGTDSSMDAGSTLKKKLKANTSVGMVPKSMTKAALVKEATEREALRKEFIYIQTAVKATEIAIPFVFYDGANTPGGMVRMTKGDFIWLFLDKSRRVGAELGVGEQANAVKAWARVGVDDLMLVRGTIIIPHHYDFYYFLMNKSRGPGGELIFPYSADAPEATTQQQEHVASTDVLSTAASRAAAAKSIRPVEMLEGADGDPAETKVVDRRWYEKNKHIYPASTWQEFDAEKDYKTEVRKDAGGNTFFFSK